MTRLLTSKVSTRRLRNEYDGTSLLVESKERPVKESMYRSWMVEGGRKAGSRRLSWNDDEAAK